MAKRLPLSVASKTYEAMIKNMNGLMKHYLIAKLQAL